MWSKYGSSCPTHFPYTQRHSSIQIWFVCRLEDLEYSWSWFSQWLKNAYANLVLRDFSPFQAREKSLGTRLAYAWENPSPPAQSYYDSLSLLVTATLTSFSWVAFFSLAMIWNKFSDKYSSANSARSRNGFSFPLALIKETQKLRNRTLQNLNAT